MNKEYQLQRLRQVLTASDLRSGLYQIETDLTDEDIENYLRETDLCTYLGESFVAASGGKALELFVIGLSYQCQENSISEQRTILLTAGKDTKDRVLYSLLILMFKHLGMRGRTVIHMHGDHDLSVLTHENMNMLYEAMGHHKDIIIIASKNKNGEKDRLDPLINNIVLKEENKYRLMENRLSKVHISYKHDDAYEEALKAIKAGLEENNIPYSIDDYDIKYGDDIDEYEKEIGAADRIIMFVIPTYFESIDCMFEMTQMFKNGRVKERLFPVVDMGDKIKRNGDGLTLVKDYWHDEKQRKSERMTKEPGSSKFIMSEIQKIDEIIQTLDDLWLFICRKSTGRYEDLIENNAAKLIEELKRSLPQVEATIDKKFIPSDGDAPEKTRYVLQNGAKSVYIENNTGTVNVN